MYKQIDQDSTPQLGVSVIMPVFNQEQYVRMAITSVLDQTHSDFEFLIVDDGSTDKTVEVIESFRDDRIRLIKAPHGGFISALKLGTSEARGKWVARMDSDDVCRPDRLEKQLAFLNSNPGYSFVTSYYGIVTLNNKFLTSKRSDVSHDLSPLDITRATHPFCDPGTIFDRKLALEIGYDDEYSWEKTLWYGLLSRGKGAVLEDPLYFVRWRLGSVSRGQNKYPGDMSYKIHLKYDRENARKPEPPRSNKIDIRNEKKCVYFYSAAGDIRAAMKTAIRAWRMSPFRLETTKLLFRSLGIPRLKKVPGPAGVSLFPVSSPMKAS